MQSALVIRIQQIPIFNLSPDTELSWSWRILMTEAEKICQYDERTMREVKLFDLPWPLTTILDWTWTLTSAHSSAKYKYKVMVLMFNGQTQVRYNIRIIPIMTHEEASRSLHSAYLCCLWSREKLCAYLFIFIFMSIFLYPRFMWSLQRDSIWAFFFLRRSHNSKLIPCHHILKNPEYRSSLQAKCVIH